MVKRKIRFGVIGCGLMGREFASASARWCHLEQLDEASGGLGAAPEIIAACDVNEKAAQWFEKRIPSLEQITTDYHDLLANPDVEAVYCAVPHNLHAQIYTDILHAGKHLLGEKPFGIDRAANDAINEAIAERPNLLVRCSSEFPFFPGAYRIAQWVDENRFGRIIDVEAGFWHSSDLNPDKPINWKRMVDVNGAYGCMGDLGMHVLHLPLRFGWMPTRLRALLSNVMTTRPGPDGTPVPCETWDNAILACDVDQNGASFPMVLSTKRIAPGHADTWFIRIHGTDFSAEFSTKNPKELRYLPYEAGDEQAWRVVDVPYRSAYGAITGSIFEFGFTDAVLQMWAAFCDELVRGEDMLQPLRCATPEEATRTHDIFTAALTSQASGQTIEL